MREMAPSSLDSQSSTHFVEEKDHTFSLSPPLEPGKLAKYSGKQANCDSQVFRQVVDGEAPKLWT